LGRHQHRKRQSNRKKRQQEFHKQKPFQRQKVKSRTPGQQQLIRAINTNRIIFATGPAGTGKTHLSIGLAVEHMLKSDGNIDNIILTRPVVTVDEDLGFLPGNVDSKIHEYLVPMYEELRYFASHNEIGTWKQNSYRKEPESLQITPLGFMRGRNFHRSFIVLDEAQNSSKKQLKNILTRLGKHSKIVLTGDMGQTDLPYGKSGMFEQCISRMVGATDTVHIELQRKDIQRDDLVAEVDERLEGW
jgi:phosphate starvation-inducible PhoH-like protein